jgi:hypothetical protein
MPAFLLNSESTDPAGGTVYHSYVLTLRRTPQSEREILEVQGFLCSVHEADVVLTNITELVDEDRHPGYKPYYGYYLSYVIVHPVPRYVSASGNRLWIRSMPILTFSDIDDIETKLANGRPGLYVRIRGITPIELTPEQIELLEQQGFGR